MGEKDSITVKSRVEVMLALKVFVGSFRWQIEDKMMTLVLLVKYSYQN